jgi:hypothetical protein
VANGGTVEELHAEVDALEGALVMHKAVLQDAEQRAVAGQDEPMWQAVAAVHHTIVDEYTEEIRLLRAEILLLPAQRQPS